MSEHRIEFSDGNVYERTMGVWSRLAGDVFLDWLAPATGLRWIDIGCGSGAFTALLAQRCAPLEIHGIDPSEHQLAFARARPDLSGTRFHQGDAMALPFPDARFDAAVMALVIFFVPDPAKGVAEMVRVVRPGGMVASYAWDRTAGGNPFTPVMDEMRAMGVTPPSPPSPAASRLDSLRDLWIGCGLEVVETRVIAVERTFADFDDFWNVATMVPSVRPAFEAMTKGDAAQLKDRLRARQPADAAGRITYGARANAISGRVPV